MGVGWKGRRPELVVVAAVVDDLENGALGLKLDGPAFEKARGARDEGVEVGRVHALARVPPAAPNREG